MTCFPGWTWEYIDDQMTLPRLKSIMAYQKDHPPTHIMIAAYFGIGKEGGSGKSSSSTDENGNSLFDLLPMG